MLDADRDTLIAFALDHGMLDPTFPPFVGWCEANGVDVAIVSDGFAFYIEPMMRAAGLGHVTVITNEQAWRGRSPRRPAVRERAPELHRVRHVQDAGGPAVPGARAGRVRRRRADGPVRRALRRRHVREARARGVLRRPTACRSSPWEDFDDVRRTLGSAADLPGPVVADTVSWMDDAVALPRGLTARALTLDDVDDVVVLVNACEKHDVGFPMWEREDLTSDFRLPGVDPRVDSIGVFDDTRLDRLGVPSERTQRVGRRPSGRPGPGDRDLAPDVDRDERP